MKTVLTQRQKQVEEYVGMCCFHTCLFKKCLPGVHTDKESIGSHGTWIIDGCGLPCGY